MAEPGSAGLREQLEKLALAGVGSVAFTADRADGLAEALARRGGMTRDEAKRVIDEQTARWRDEASRLGERAGAGLHTVLRELGVASRDELIELELKVAQLDHRLRLARRRSLDGAVSPHVVALEPAVRASSPARGAKS